MFLEIVADTSLGHDSFRDTTCQDCEHIKANHDNFRPQEHS
jgi:hypothetical protein